VANSRSEGDLLLNQLADEFAARYRRGERPSLTEYVDRYPALADDIRELFPALVGMEQVKEDRREVGTTAGVLPPLEQLGDYRILREIGHGGMGVVYEAEQVSLGRHVALKVLPRHLLPEAKQRRRFEREAKAAAQLHHTNIVPVFGVGEHGGLSYYAMQFIQGLGLDEVIAELKRMQPGGGDSPVPAGNELRAARKEVSAAEVARSLITGAFQRVPEATVDEVPAADEADDADPAPEPAAGRLSDTFRLSPSTGALSGSPGDSSRKTRQWTYWQSVARIGVQVAGALEHAHQQGILHRDIKPSNLLLDTHGIVWVTDFGLAKVADQENLTEHGDILGTLRYMPPEAFEGRADRRADVYALGLTLYELLALRPAFDETDRNKVVKQVMSTEPPRLDRLNPAIPRDLVTIVHKAADRDPARRYPTAGELADDLEHFLADEPIRARRQTQLERYLRWARRNPGIAVLGGVLTAVLALVTLASLLAAGYFNQLRLNEAQAADEARRRGDAERWERYRSNIAAASAALQLHQSDTARRRLEEAPEQHRNWEWQYLHSQLSGARAILRGHGGEVWAVEYSRDGRWLASRSRKGTTRLWQMPSGQEAGTLGDPDEQVTAIRFSPAGLLAAGYWLDGLTAVRIWDPARRHLLGEFRARGYVQALAWSADSRWLAANAGAEDPMHRPTGHVLLWDASAGRVAGEAVTDGIFHQLAFRPGSPQLARCYGTAGRVWDIAAGKDAFDFAGARASCYCLAYSPDGRHFAAGFDHPENSVRLYDAATGHSIAVMTGHSNTVNTVAFSPDGSRLASCSHDQTARLWDGNTGQLLAVLRGHTGGVDAGTFTPDGKLFVTASDDRTLRLWDAVTGELVTVLRGHGDAVGAVAVSPDGRTIASASNDQTVRLWDVELAIRNGVLRGHTTFVYDVAVRPDGGQIASASWDGTVRLWDPTTGRETGVLQLPDRNQIVGGVAYHPEGRRLVSISRNELIRIWDVEAKKPIRDIRAPTGGWTGDARAAFNPAGTLLAVGSALGSVHLFNPDTGEVLAVLPVPTADPDESVSNVRDVAFSPDGSLLAISCFDHTVRVWDVATRTERHVLKGHTVPVYAVAFSADGALLASADQGDTVRLWDTATFLELKDLPHGSKVHRLAFSPDGTRLATACADNTIRLWDVGSGQEVAELRGHANYVHALAWSPDGTRLVSGSGDFTVRVWDSLSVQERARRAADTQQP
jgi:WD40 repeat protein